MAQAVDRLVGRRAALMLASLLLGGCQCVWPQTGTTEAGLVADPEAGTVPVPSCPQVTEAEAWVNRMPGIGDTPAKLIVSLRISTDEPWMLMPALEQEAGAPATSDMVLDLMPGGNSVPGTVAYRQPQPAPLPEAIRIVCQGGEAARIDEILIVQ